jgi:two-component system cell cycle response regulator CtrA
MEAEEMRVLLVEDDQAAVRGLVLLLKSSGAVVDTVDSGEEALGLVRHYDYDLVVLDQKAPDAEGFDIVRRIRAGRIDVPVLVIAGACRPQTRVKALSVGADDFITRPYDGGELLARIQAVIRRSKGFSQSILRIGPLSLNLDSRQVIASGTEVHLTGKEYAILELLVLRRGMVLTKEAFLNHLYGGMDEPEMKIIDVFICKLRKKLSLAGADGLIGTVWGRGYMMRDSSFDRMAAPAAAMAAEAVRTAA